MPPNKTAEEEARDLIDEQLARAGWFVCDRAKIDLVNHQGVAVREVILDKGHGRMRLPPLRGSLRRRCHRSQAGRDHPERGSVADGHVRSRSPGGIPRRSRLR